jgi:WD40 repeat protein
VLTGSEDGTARLWSAATGKELTPPLMHPGTVDAVAFSPDGKKVLTGSFDKMARLWRAGTGKELPPPLGHEGAVGAVAFSPDGKKVLTASREPAPGKPVAMYLALLAWPKRTRLWDAATGEPLGPPRRHPGDVLAIAFRPDGRAVVADRQDKTVRVWDAASGKPLTPPLTHQGPPILAAFSPDGKALLTGTSDNTARLWDAADGQPLTPPLPHAGPVWVGAFGPDGQSVVTGSGNPSGPGEARLWDAATGKALGPPLPHPAAVMAVAFSPDGNRVLTAGLDNTARLWDLPSSVQGKVGRIKVWLRVLTGMELDEGGAVRVLDARSREKARRELQDLGGPPLP